eukprot:2864188-Pyramimonas_sp.AAC.1
MQHSSCFYYDLGYVPMTRVWVADPDPKHSAQWLKSCLSPPILGYIRDDCLTWIKHSADRPWNNIRQRREDFS